MPTQLLDFDNCAGRVFPCPYCQFTHNEYYTCVNATDFGAAEYEDRMPYRPKPDLVNHPPHYNKAGIEVIDVIEAYAPTNYHLGNVIKYVCRSGHKGHEIEDLKKARWYLDRYITANES